MSVFLKRKKQKKSSAPGAEVWCTFFFGFFSCAFFVVHEEAMHMTSTPGFGVNLFFPFIFSLVFL